MPRPYLSHFTALPPTSTRHGGSVSVSLLTFIFFPLFPLSTPLCLPFPDISSHPPVKSHCFIGWSTTKIYFVFVFVSVSLSVCPLCCALTLTISLNVF